MSLRVTTCSPVCPHELVQSKHRGAREHAGREREAVCARAHTWYPRSPDARPGNRPLLSSLVGGARAQQCGPRAALWGAGSLGAGSWPHWLPAPAQVHVAEQARGGPGAHVLGGAALLQPRPGKLRASPGVSARGLWAGTGTPRERPKRNLERSLALAPLPTAGQASSNPRVQEPAPAPAGRTQAEVPYPSSTAE